MRLNPWKLKSGNIPCKLFAKDNLVDPLSLFMSFKSTKDERVEMVLDTLLEIFYIWAYRLSHFRDTCFISVHFNDSRD